MVRYPPRGTACRNTRHLNWAHQRPSPAGGGSARAHGRAGGQLSGPPAQGNKISRGPPTARPARLAQPSQREPQRAACTVRRALRPRRPGWDPQTSGGARGRGPLPVMAGHPPCCSPPEAPLPRARPQDAAHHLPVPLAGCSPRRRRKRAPSCCGLVKRLPGDFKVTTRCPLPGGGSRCVSRWFPATFLRG